MIPIPTMAIPLHAGIYVYAHNISWLPQISLSSVTHLYDSASRTLLSQTFVNPSTVSQIQSAKYTFPLYESSAIVSFRCYVGDRLIEGVIKEKEEAMATYQAAVDRQEPASLLEQHTPDVFSTSLGIIPPAATVVVEIEYIMELKHDAEVDGLRFTIPTSIAPRYGALPSGLASDPSRPAVTVKGMNISVQVSMSSNIKSLQSPSHPISMYLGGHSMETSDNDFNPRQALATLGQTSTELGKDFVILIKCAALSSPSAVLETHPTIPNSKALMLTLVPKFILPEASKPEVVFIVDRSGSMQPRVAPLRSSLSVFLRSLPLDVNFNICSFGSTYSFLWDQSRPYSNQSFAEAQRYCDSMQADFGGTEMLPAVKATIDRRFKDLNLEIMVLTDGQVWNSEHLLQYVEKETAKGDARVFSLGIGQDVSHSLIDGLARVGRGFSQVVADEREAMESKVARMLRGALSAHVLNYRVEWEGKPREEGDTTRQLSPPSSTARSTPISLFNPHVDADTPISFSGPPDFIPPSVLQAPYKLPPLFPFSRSTAYAILTTDARPPSRVWLRGTTPAGDELELEIPVERLPGSTIHQLAARKILQELKDGTGYLHGGTFAISQERNPGGFAEWVKKEGVRVGLTYGVASQWTSFVAVVKEEGQVVVGDGPSSGLDDREEFEFVEGDDDDGDDGDGRPGASGNVYGGGFGPRPSSAQPPQSAAVMMMMAPPPPPVSYPKSKSGLFSKATPPSPTSTFSSLSSDSTLIGTKSADHSKYAGGGPKKKYSLGSSTLPPVQKAEAVPSPKYYSSFPQQQSSQSAFAGKNLSTASASPSVPSSFGAQQPTPPSAPSFFGSLLSARAKGKGSDKVGRRMFGFKGAKTGDGGSLAADSGPLSGSMGSMPPIMTDLDRDKTSLSAYPKSFSLPKGSGSGTDIAISYSPSSIPPSERLSSETGVQPLSLKTKSLINLQTFAGCFVLNQALAAVLGVSFATLEEKLKSFVSSDAGMSQEHRRSVWATVLAVKFFETQVAGERGVWQLVVDKARVWMRESAVLGDVDARELEKMAEDVLHVYSRG